MRTLLTLAAAVAVASAPALAQTSFTPAPAFLGPAPADGGSVEWTPRVSARTVSALRSPSFEERLDALYTLADMAANPLRAVDLRPATQALLEVFRQDSDPRLRVMALRSLEAMADDEVMEALRDEAWAETRRPADLRVRRTLLAVLVAHYGASPLRIDRGVVALAETLPVHLR